MMPLVAGSGPSAADLSRRRYTSHTALSVRRRASSVNLSFTAYGPSGFGNTGGGDAADQSVHRSIARIASNLPSFSQSLRARLGASSTSGQVAWGDNGPGMRLGGSHSSVGSEEDAVLPLPPQRWVLTCQNVRHPCSVHANGLHILVLFAHAPHTRQVELRQHLATYLQQHLSAHCV